MLDSAGIAGFSLPKLGRALGTEATAVYRHFASKDDLVAAIADRLIEESSAGLQPGDCWMATLAEITRRLRATYLAHPAAASLSACRVTQSPAEMRVADIIAGAVLQAGFDGAEAARACRAIGGFARYWAGCEAAFLALDERLQETDEAAWTNAYLAADRKEYPHIWQVRTHLPDVQDDEIFETMLSFIIGAMVQRAPRPCRCGAHGNQPGQAGHAGRGRR